MNDLFRKLLNLQSLDLADPAVSFGFERPLPAWAWAGVFIAAFALALWSYSRLAGNRWARWSLGVVRAALLLLLVTLLCGPQLVKRSDLSENDWVLVLVDRSASLAVADAEFPGEAGRVTRERQLTRALETAAPMWSTLAADRTIIWLGFDAGAYDLPASSSSTDIATPQLAEAKGLRTSLGAALDQALARAAARPLAGVVIISDGRSIDEPSRQALRRLESERVPVVSVALGSEKPVGDLAVRRVDAPRLAFVKDLTPVRVEVERTGGDTGSSTALVRLIDRDTGRVLDEKTVTFDPQGAARTVLTHRSDLGGPANWAVEVAPESGGGGGGADLITANNRAELALQLIDRPLRVLYVDGYPRWEQRYLKNLLVREKSISCSTLILSPDKKFIQEGDVELDTLPDSPERWAEFDAVVLGDVSPDVFTREQLAQLKEHVARRGGGLIWVAGPSFTPLAWVETPLADLLPFQKEAVDGTTLANPVLMKPTPEADRLALLRLSDPGEENPWPAALAKFETGWSQLYWVQRIEPTRLKPTTEVLATADKGDNELSSERPFPILLTMKYGAGRVIYSATDETWRWRYARGETLYERFWTPMIRLLGRDALARSGQPALLEVSPSRAVVDQPVRVSVQLLDQSLVDLGLTTITVRAAPKKVPGQDDLQPLELTLRAEGPVTTPSARAIDAEPRAASRMYSTIWLPSAAGEYTFEVQDTALAGRLDKGSQGLTADAEVFLPDDELRSPDANHALLASLSTRTGGVVLKPENLDTLPSHLPNRKVRIVNESAQPLWDTPMALLLTILLLTVEWVCRRVIRLV
ncbi:MAG: hypothetical protein ACKVZJ_02825 [Phycisphaerales bacterium]